MGEFQHKEVVDRLAHDMYYAEDCVTVRLARGEARMLAGETRMNTYDKAFERRETKQNVILGCSVTVVLAILVHFIFHIG